MKFENDYLKIIIEKKQLSMEQKKTKKQTFRKRRPAILIALLLIAAVVSGTLYSRFHAAGGEAQVADSNQGVMPAAADEEVYGQVEGEYVATAHLAAGLQDKYADKSLYNYTYGDPIENVGRDETITFQLGYDVADLGLDQWTEVFALYQDPELTEEMGVKYSFDEETGTFTMLPSDTFTIYKIRTSGLYVDTIETYPHSKNYLFDLGAGNSWGNLGTAYLACYYDKETGEKLDRPEVSIVTFKGEIEEAPRLSYSITDDGRPEFYWNEVEGADEYMVCQTVKTEGQSFSAYLSVLSITEGTSWKPEALKYDLYNSTNDIFKTYRISEDDWKDEYNYESNLEKYGEPGVPHYDFSGLNDIKGICVVAVNQKGTSMISNIFDNTELASYLPNEVAENTEEENGFASFAMKYDSVEKLPSYDYITMCDGYTSTKLIDYQTQNAYIKAERFMVVDSDTKEFIGAETSLCLMIPYRVEGTEFINEFIVSPEDGDYNEADMEKDLAYLEEREEKLRKKAGAVGPEISLQFATHEDLKPEKIRKVNTTVFANSALSEYLAVNMLSGAGMIDLGEFPEAKDTNLVEDAIMEAYYQNPLILGIVGYKINSNGTAVKVIYEESLEEQARKQEEIKNKVSEIIEEIITGNMTEREKELAINQYLCDTIVYDEDALLNAEEHGYMYTDEEFKDSFTAYGALINGKCVCAGYAAAFKLLAEEAGLEAIVVTGFLNGSLAHAWNKIKIDGEWQIVDVTNNDNEYFFNALLNLPAFVGDRVLIEDKKYMLDKVISDYVGDSDSNEYYHITDNYFPAQEAAEKLSAELEKNGEVTLRTDYELNDEKFYAITDAVYEIMGDDIDLYGYYWLGVIYLISK